MRTILVLLAGLVLTGCGGSLDESMEGRWEGAFTFTFQGLEPIASTGFQDIAVDGDAATIDGMCPDGGGILTLHGSGKEADWNGLYSCPGAELLGCSSVEIDWYEAELRMDGAELVMSANGPSSGCNTERDITMTFSGTK